MPCAARVDPLSPLLRAIEDGDIEVLDLWEEGDGLQDNTFVKRKASKVLMELISHERMAGRQHFGYQLSKDAMGNRVLGDDANGSVSFELAQIAVGPDRVPTSIVRYIDGKYCPYTVGCLYICYDIIYDIMHDII